MAENKAKVAAEEGRKARLCRCKNHNGGEKQRYGSNAEAVEAIITRHMKFGPHEAYECHKIKGNWHVRSTGRRK